MGSLLPHLADVRSDIRRCFDVGIQPDNLTWPRLIAFSAPTLPLALLLIPLTTLLPTYYGQTTGLSLQTIGFVFLAARLFDGLIDPLIGLASDRTPARYGRRRLWMIVGALLAMLGCWLVFFPESDSTAVRLTLSLAVLYAGWTMIAVPHYSWTAELSNDYAARSKIAGIRDGMYFLGVVVGAVLIGVLSQIYQGIDGRLLAALGLVSLGLLPIMVITSVVAVPEAPVAHRPQPVLVDLKAAFGVLRDAPPFRRLVVLFGCAQFAAAVSNALSFLYMQHVQEAPQSVGLLVLVFFGATLLGLPLWVRLSYRYTKHRICALCCVVLVVVSALIFLIPKGQVSLYLILVVLAGLANGGALSLPNAITADVVDYDTLINRGDRAGLFFSLKLLVVKLSNALAVGVAFPLLGAFGFQAAGTNTDQALLVLRLLYCALPIPLLAITIVLLWNFPLDRHRVRVMQRRIASRRDRAALQAAISVQTATAGHS
jgi:Na+/melibiose symporter-like transporter